MPSDITQLVRALRETKAARSRRRRYNFWVPFYALNNIDTMRDCRRRRTLYECRARLHDLETT